MDAAIRQLYMAGKDELYTHQQQGGEEGVKTNSSFVWDENSQLYYHSSTGFYFNPQEDWYYSSRDGLYYKFENGNYVLLSSDSNQVEQCETSDKCEMVGSENVDEDLQCVPADSHKNDEGLAESVPIVPDKNTTGEGENDAYELEEGEWILDEVLDSTYSSWNICGEGTSWEEENWRAQYGQVTQSYVECALDIRIVDLWDWEMIGVTGTRKDGNRLVARLVGSLVKSSSKLHPSVPSGRVQLKTAPIRKAHLDLVQVKSGQIYRLKRPSSQYLASILTYDSSNPTKEWGFPQLSLNSQIQQLPRIDGRGSFHEASTSSEQPHELEKEKLRYAYRDRAAERRSLHGGFGIGPGQKKEPNGSDLDPSSPTSACPEEAAAESLSISFGAGSYARRLLENLGWKEGEALGRSTKGLVEPLQAIGNKGNAGLGWNDSRKKNSLFPGRG